MTVADLYPLDGPHTAEQVIAAARDVDNLVRDLNHATRGHALDVPADLYTVLGALVGAVSKLPQLLEQAAAHADRYTTTAGLYDDRGGNPAVTAAEVRQHLWVTHRAVLHVIDPLAAAHEACGRLGAQTPEETS